MLNKSANLTEKLFAKDIPQAPNRDGYGLGVVEAAQKDERIVVMCADLTESTRNLDFKKHFPNRFIQAGVQEQFLAAGAAGLALAGKIPFITSYAMFCPGRAWEQVRTNICLNNVKVNIVGSHAGVSVGPDGATHQAIEDIAIMRVIPNITIIAPCDAVEAKKATLAAANYPGPCYIRLAREKSPIFTTAKTPFKIGRAEIYRKGNDVALVACGPLVYNTLLAAEELSKKGIEARVINCHTIKPLDQKTILEAAKNCGAVVTIEEHQIAGGLGGAVAELLAKHLPTPQEFIGIHDKFGESGKPNELVEYFGMGVKSIVKAAMKVVRRK
ncbi:MAG: transketolase family protein [Candidatus Magasanikbacteria bacterium]|nr:transketolase family protein [Candidatus Magasanikbacteria bacterium]